MINKTTILIIDDDPNLRKTLSDILRTKGYETLTAKDGAEGLSIIRMENVHLALIDLRLPDISGLEVLNRIKADKPRTEAIILTGNATLDSAIEATNKGAFSYLQKPYDIDQLMLQIRRAIEKHKSEEKIREYQEHLEELVRERTVNLEAEVAERKRAEDEIRKLNEDLRQRVAELEEAFVLAKAGLRARGEFLANISHELITPLNSIIGFSQILLDGLSGPMNEQQKEYAASILQSGNRLHETLKEIVQFADLASGELKLHTDRFLLNDLLKSSLLAINEKAAMRGVTLSLETGLLPETELEADRSKLQQVIFNLLDNAVKFTPAGGSVRVAARRVQSSELRFQKPNVIIMPPAPPPPLNLRANCRLDGAGGEGELIEISVIDTGIGIEPENMPRLFNPFQQLESPYTKKYMGTGLGLLLAKKLIELHGGGIWVESKFGKGSTFTFAIPMKQTGDD